MIGRLKFVNKDDYESFDVGSAGDESQVELVMEPKRGRVIVFSSGHENTHHFERVTSGQRFVLSFWFTCDQSKEFEIFLDGNAHVAFSHKFRAAAEAKQQQLKNKKSTTSKKEL